jgi:hypothetical protein
MNKKIYKTVKNIYILAIPLLFLNLLAGCKSKPEVSDNADYFSNDKTKLGIEVTDQELGIKFFPPSGWELRPTLISKRAIGGSRSTKDTGDFSYIPIYVFFNDTTSGLFSVGKVEGGDSSLTKSARLNYYKSALAEKYKANKLVIGSFINSRIAFTHIKLEKENLVSIKLLFMNQNRDVIQFDYTVPANRLPHAIDAIKASIGSIKFM